MTIIENVGLIKVGNNYTRVPPKKKTCESCYHMRGNLSIYKGKFQLSGYRCACRKRLMEGRIGKEFVFGKKPGKKFKSWRIALNCPEYESMNCEWDCKGCRYEKICEYKIIHNE